MFLAYQRACVFGQPLSHTVIMTISIKAFPDWKLITWRANKTSVGLGVCNGLPDQGNHRDNDVMSLSAMVSLLERLRGEET